VSANRTLILVFVGLGTLVAGTGAWGAHEQHRRITTWREVPATVTESTSRRHRSETVTRIRYRYRAGGAEHESDRLLPGPFPLGWAGTVAEQLARFPVGAAVSAWHDPERPERAFLIPSHSFVPYLVFLLSVPFFALATGVATGGVENVPSGRLQRGPAKRADGWWEVPAFREWLAMRNASLAAWALLLAAGFFAFTDYVAKARRPGPLAMLIFLAWLWFLARLAWSVFKRTVVARRLEEARLFVRAEPRAGRPFAVRVEQAAPASLPRGAAIRALEATLVCEETRTRYRGRHMKSKSATKTVCRERAVLGRDLLARPGAPARGEGTIEVPAKVGEGDGWLKWRVDVRTRLFGPDYTTRFPIAFPDDED
jgi:hypothetical protein